MAPIVASCLIVPSRMILPLRLIGPLRQIIPSHLIVPACAIISLCLMDANKVTQPNHAYAIISLITLRTLPKEPIQGIRPRNLSKDLFKQNMSVYFKV